MPKRHCHGATITGEPCGMNPVVTGNYCWRHKHQDPSYDPANPSTARRHGRQAIARTERWDRQGWLLAFEYAGTVSAACDMFGVKRNVVYQERQRNEDFATAWADIEERMTESMERELYRRAVEGIDEPLVSAGKQVTTVKRYSDGLLTLGLKARRPDRYRDNVKIEHSGSVDRRIRVDLAKLSDAEVEQLEHIARALEAS